VISRRRVRLCKSELDLSDLEGREVSTHCFSRCGISVLSPNVVWSMQPREDLGGVLVEIKTVSAHSCAAPVGFDLILMLYAVRRLTFMSISGSQYMASHAQRPSYRSKTFRSRQHKQCTVSADRVLGL
jgi:hypothetical protein